MTVQAALQSRGLGGTTLRWILDYVGDDPIYLECTRKDNTGLYENIGFEVVEEVKLVGEAAPGPNGRVQSLVVRR